jgi:hypothetical protein
MSEIMIDEPLYLPQDSVCQIGIAKLCIEYRVTFAGIKNPCFTSQADPQGKARGGRF